MLSTLAQSKERKGSNFAIWQPWRQEEIKLEEQRLRTEREKIEKEREEAERRPSVVGVAARVGPSGASLTDSNRSSFQASDQKSNLSTQFAATVEHLKKHHFFAMAICKSLQMCSNWVSDGKLQSSH